MATIEVGIRRSPAAYSDMNQGHIDDNFANGTTVIVTATVTNVGNASGTALLSLYDSDVPAADEGWGDALDAKRITVRAAEWGVDDDLRPGEGTFPEIRYGISQPDTIRRFVAEVTTDNGETILATRVFSVNPYTIPTAPLLSTGIIDVRVI